jgi:hypothetical protein
MTQFTWRHCNDGTAFTRLRRADGRLRQTLFQHLWWRAGKTNAGGDDGALLPADTTLAARVSVALHAADSTRRRKLLRALGITTR